MAAIDLHRHEVEEGWMPPFCACCGQKGRHVAAKTVVWIPWWEPVLVLCTGFLFLIPFVRTAVFSLFLGASSDKPVTLHLPFCRRHRFHWAWRFWLRTLVLLASLGLIALGATGYTAPHYLPRLGDDTWLLVGAGGLLGLVLWRVLGTILTLTAVHVQDLTVSALTLGGVAEAFCSAVERQRRKRTRSDQPFETSSYDERLRSRRERHFYPEREDEEEATPSRKKDIQKTCSVCSAPMEAGARVCVNCGKREEETVPLAPEEAVLPQVVPLAQDERAVQITESPAAPADKGKKLVRDCPQCGTALGRQAVLCVSCGYDTRTGRRHAGVKRRRRSRSASGPRVSDLLGIAAVLAGLVAVAVGLGKGMGALSILNIAVPAALGAGVLTLLGVVVEAACGRGISQRGLVNGMLGLGLGVLALMVLVPSVRKVRLRAHAANLRQIGLAMYNYDASFQTLPPPAIRSKTGKPLLSWRVALLPFLEQEALYRQFKLDEPWDSAHNKPLLAAMPAVYRLPGQKAVEPFATHYQVVAGPGTPFAGPTGRGLHNLSDGTSNTLMVVEAAEGVPWTKPEDLPFAPQGPLPRLGTWSGNYAMVFCDGSLHFLAPSVGEATLRALITCDGGEVASFAPYERFGWEGLLDDDIQRSRDLFPGRPPRRAR